MAQVKVYNGGSVSTAEVDSSVFGERILGRTLKEAVVMYEANLRQGTHKTKTRAEVAGPNHKLWKQKHTGRARMGSEKAPHWTGGGVAFGPRPRDYSFHMPKKARRAALRNAVFSKFQDGEVCVAQGWPTGTPSTKTAVAVLRALGIERSALVVTAEQDRVLWMSLRNVPGVDVRPVADLNARDVLLRRHMVLTPAALESIKTRLASTKAAGGKAAN